MQDTTGPDDLKVSGLFSYPIKGCRAVEHDSALVLTSGLRHDREWMLVDTRHSPAQFVSQRECPLMATVRVDAMDDGGIVLSSDCGDTLAVPPLSTASALIKVRVWSHETIAQDAGDPAARWMADKLALPCSSVRLVRFHPEMRRECNRLYAGESGAHTLFADGYPILVANAESLRDLNARMGRVDGNAMPMNRFRPNIVLEGLPAWDEDHVEVLSVGGVVMRLVKPCVRCQVTTTDQASGSRLSEEPLNTLGRFRNNPDFGGVTFGWNAVVVTGGAVTVGDQVVAEYRF